jgi:hypothetical protein
MSRSFTAGSLVRLPRLTAVSAARLMTELLSAAAAEKKLPAAIAADRDELESARDALQAELSKRLAADGEESPQIAAADRVEDNAFGALADWLAAIARLPAERHPEGAKARAALQAIFPSGLEFLKLRTRDEWQEAETRLKRIENEDLDGVKIRAVIEGLGGKPFLAELAHAHKEYGEVLGITTPAAASDPPAVREAYEAALEALRGYVLVVSAHVKKSDPHSAARAARLLAPLTTWRDRAPRGGAVEEPAAPALGEGELA